MDPAYAKLGQEGERGSSAEFSGVDFFAQICSNFCLVLLSFFFPVKEKKK